MSTGKKRFLPKGFYNRFQREPYTRLPIYMPRKRYEELYEKASVECPTAAPVHDILELLLEYYFENEFILSRKVITSELEEDYTDMKKRPKGCEYDGREDVTLWMRLQKWENDKFNVKARKDGATKNFIMNLLVDFYLKNKFEIKTQIIRVNRQQKRTHKKK